MKKNLMMVLAIMCSLFASAETYYLTPDGNGRNSGLSPQSGWDAATASRFHFTSDTIVIVGTVTGTLTLGSDEIATVTKPVVVRSNGTTSSIDGIYVQNLGNVNIINVKVVSKGLSFFKNIDTPMGNILIDSCEVSGHIGEVGLNIGCQSSVGYDGIVIRNTSIHNNDKNGLLIWGPGDAYVNRNITIYKCTAYSNLGVLTNLKQNTGSGIVVANSENVTIDGCVAYNNGENNRNAGGGPVGIWVYNTRYGTIKNCESYGNHAGLYNDGGGFDIDGGSQYCVIENCYSHDNDGPGYLMAEYGSTNQYKGNIIRNNRSQNDGLKNNHGVLALWAVDGSHSITDCVIENNTFFVGVSRIAINIMSDTFVNTLIQNNTFYVKSGTQNVSGSSSGITLVGNSFLPEGTLPIAPNSYQLKRVGPNQYEGSFVASVTTDTKEFWVMVSTNGIDFKKIKVIVPDKIIESQTIKFTFTYED